MGRRIHGTERKVRHTITIDGDLVRRACAYGDAMKITGFSAAIECLVRRALDNCAGDADLRRRTSRVETFIAIRIILQKYNVAFDEFPIYGAYRADFRTDGHYIIAGLTPSSAFDAAKALYQHRRGKIIAVVPTIGTELANAIPVVLPTVRIMDLVDFDRWAKKRGRPRKQSVPSD